MRMWEYDFEQKLREFFGVIRATPDVLDYVFDVNTPDSLPDTQRAALKAWFADPANAQFPLIKQGFPLETPQLDLISIVLSGSSESRADIGQSVMDFGIGESYTVPTDEGQVALWSITLRHEYQIVVYSQNADMTIWLQKLALYCMTLARHFLDSAGMQNVQLGGGDFLPQPEWMPTPVFSRAVTVAGDVTDYVRQDTPLGLLAGAWVTALNA